MRQSPQPMPPERDAHQVEAMAEFMARILATRPCMFVRSNKFLSWVNADSPVYDRSRPRCRSCDSATSRGRVLCDACRRNPIVVLGAPLVDTMYRSSNPLYEMDDEKQRAILYLKHQQKLAENSLALAEQLADWAWRVYRRFVQGGDGNVYFTSELVWGCGSYGAVVRCGFERRAVFGGLGLRLHAELRPLIVEWLFALDARIREHFDIPLDPPSTADDSLAKCIENYACLIANRVALFETADMDPSQRLCSEGCEHIARMQFLKCEFFAQSAIVRDISAMRALMLIAREGIAPLDPQPLLHVLQAPPPELLCLLSSVATDMAFGELRDTLGTGLDPARLQAWRDAVPTESLCMLLKRAVGVMQTWRPPPSGFLNTVRHDQAPRERGALPHMGWVHDPAVALWSLLPHKAHQHRRTGLDPAAERIVLLSSALMQMDAHEKCFVPGIAICTAVSTVTQREMQAASHAHTQLTEQMRPFTVGIEWNTSRHELMDWKASHLEDEVRRAAAVLGGYSVCELRDRFLNTGAHRHLLQPAMARMLVQPRRGYETWCEASLQFLLPILQQYREGIGCADNVATKPEGDILRLLPAVREWKPGSGTLTITAGEAYAVPPVKELLQRMERAGLIAPQKQQKRRGQKGSKRIWELESDQLERVLS